MLGSCKSLKLTNKQVYVEPLPLEVVAGNVTADVHLNFPAKTFPKKTTLRVTPVIRYRGGEQKGQAVFYQGEKVMNNYTVIPYHEGANVVQKLSIPFTSKMRTGVLFLKLAVRKSGDWKELPELRVAEGVKATEELATVEAISPAFAPAGFQRIIKEAYDADILFQIQQANLRSSQLRKDEVKEWKYLVQNAKETPNQKVTVEVQAYASPDGGMELNERLSEARERNTKRFLKRDFRRHKMSDVEINAHYTAEDWDGFKKLVQASDLKDKDLVLRVLEMYPDAESREREIKNISAVFSELAKEILPKLRRSRLIANVETQGKTDEEIIEWVKRARGYLTVEELLHAAELMKTSEEQIQIYRVANRIFPKDFRAYNNIGALLYKAGNFKLAEVWFRKAERCQENSITKMNKGLIKLKRGKLDEATSLIAAATDIPEGGQALGFLYLKKGEYAKAQKLYGDYASNNAALAQLLNKDYRKALKTIEAIQEPDATTYYIKAIISARMQKKDAVKSALAKAKELNPKVATLIEEDVEFVD